MTFVATSSDLLTADTQITPASTVSLGICAKLHGLIVLTDGTNAATVTIYDSNTTTATGKVLCKLIVPGASLTNEIMINVPVEAQRGLYADVSGTGAAYIVHYSLG